MYASLCEASADAPPSVVRQQEDNWQDSVTRNMVK
jgi:hypothetical protein